MWGEISAFFQRFLLPLAAAAAWLGVLTAAGRAALPTAAIQSPGLRCAAAAAAGIGFWGLWIQVLGLLGDLRLPWILISAGAVAVLAGRNRKSFFGDLRDACRLLRPAAWSEWLAAAWAAGILWHSLCAALVPPTDIDTLVYHLPAVRRSLDEGRIRFVPWLMLANFPFLAEMHHLTGLALGWEGWGALFQVAAAAGLCLMIVEFFPRPAGWPAAALFASMPVALPLAAAGRNDHLLALFSACMFRLAREVRRSGDRGLACAAGMFAGFAAGVKYLGLAQGLWLALFLGWKRLLIPAAAGAILTGGLWYVRNAIWTGNPVYPFGHAVFGGPFWNPQVAEAYWRMATWDGLGFTPLHFLAQPFYWIFYPEPYQYQPAIHAILWLVFVPAALIFRRKIFYALPILSYAGFHYILFFPLGEVWRFLLPVWPWLAGLAAAVVKASRPPARIAFGLLYLIGLFPAGRLSEKPSLKYLADPRPTPEARRRYLEKHLDSYPAIAWMNEHLPEGSRVLFFRDNRIDPCRHEAVALDPLNQAWIPAWPAPAPEDLERRLRREGFTHLFVNEGLLISRPSRRYYTPELIASVNKVLQRRGQRLFRQGPLSVYQLR